MFSAEGQLSPGELQRLAFARVLFRKPRLAVLDEPVSAVSPSQGFHMLELLQKEGIAMICTAQLDSPHVSCFQSALTLLSDGKGSFTWHDAPLPA